MVPSFDTYSMWYKVESVTEKTGCTSCTNVTIPFKVPGFRMKTQVLQRHFIFPTPFELQSFCVFIMNHCKQHT